MSPPALSPKRKRRPKSLPAHRGRTTTKLALALALLCGMVWDKIETSYAAISAGGQSNLESETVVLPFAKSGFLSDDVQPAAVVRIGTQTGTATCPLFDAVNLALLVLPVSVGEPLSPAIVRQAEHNMLNAVGLVLGSSGGNVSGWVSPPRNVMARTFATTYRDVRALAAMIELTRIQNEAALTRTTIVGAVSTYNPYRDSKQEGDVLTASGELYDPGAWTAAIQIDLRNQFGGIRYGRLYQPTFALVESGNKQVIVKVNDVGHLRPGRVLDLSEGAMSYFDPFLTRGLLADARITLLPGEGWTPGPIGSANLIGFTAASWRTAPAQLGPLVPADADTVLSRLGAYRAEARSNVGG